EEEELKRQITIMKEMGLGGFFMHSRTGLATEYLGDDWFALTNACADEGEKLKMEAWLYDEDRWPSGTAGGMVTENPAFRMKFMSLRTIPAEQFGWFEGIVAAFACDLDGIAYKNCQRITNDTPCSAYPRKTILVFTIEEFAKSSFYNGYTMVDVMNRAATDRYIELTHKRYEEECGEHFGKSIKGIFTDEPHRGCVMGNFSLNNENKAWMAPWTDVLVDEFQKRFGGDIIAHLPELFLQKNGERVSPIKWQYMELCQQLFLENWAAPLFDWCEDQNLLFTGHALHEDSLTAQASMQGSLMRFYEYEHIPGVDCLTEGNRNYWVVKQCSSAARQLGRPWIISELYGVTGWQFDFEGHKYVGDWQALFGVNLRCHHLSWYTMAGQAKRDYPASILHQSAWYKDYEPVETYFARLGLLLQQGKPKCDLLVINPVESLWCQIHVDWINNIATPKDAEVRTLEKAYRDLFHWLIGNHIDFDYGDEDMLKRLHRIEKHTDQPPTFWLGKASYKTILVPKMTTIRKSTLDALQAFEQAGGSVIFAGDPPPFV
ncbi:MAG: hypothetical protein MI922_22125, partial [Bacteroidales bacterium]|nr:hypothetical protein [Bacteroidales bacterium]